MRRLLPFLAVALVAAAAPRASPPPVSEVQTAADAAVPAYKHVIVIVEENKSYERIVGSPLTPRISGFARTYGNATQMYGEVHPSEGNYVAMIAGSTFGIHDDDGWATAGHNFDADSLPSQLVARKLDWRGYFGSIPAPGSLVTANEADATHAAGLYASKHNPFVNMNRLRTAPDFAKHTVGLDRFVADLDADALPAYAMVVPNQCDEMHGLPAGAPGVPADCSGEAVIRRGDRVTGELVDRVVAAPAWHGRENVAVVITFDEDDRRTAGAQGCCGYEPDAATNFGGGHIPTVVITNHGPRGVTDPTPYNHYSLMRTLEDAFGIHEYLHYAGDLAGGVKPMTPLFAVKPR